MPIIRNCFINFKPTTHLKVTCESYLSINLHRLTCVHDFRQVPYDTRESWNTKVKVKSSVASWAIVYCECRFNLTTRTVIKIMFVVIFKLESLSVVTHSISPQNSGHKFERLNCFNFPRFSRPCQMQTFSLCSIL